MGKQLRYMGEFLSRAGVVWRTEILQEADTAFAAVGVLSFPAEEPLLIEWERADKETPVCGSTATLKIISPGDRTYEDLYTIEIGHIRLDVYRNDLLYWSGTLDPEFYEEPYERYDGYEVSLTFSDFGVLDRLKYNLDGLQTLYNVVADGLSRSGINYTRMEYTRYCSTYFTDDVMPRQQAHLSALSVRSENFYDEDGEPATMEEAIESVLQPLGLKMVQRAGVVYIYDLNGLYEEGNTQRIEWDGDSQTMGTDKVANNVKVTFSPYASSKVLEDTLEYGAEYGIGENTAINHDGVNLTSNNPNNAKYGEYYSYYPDYGDSHVRNGDGWDYNLVDFTIFISDKGSGPAYVDTTLGARYFHILPLVGGGAAECSGIAWRFYTGGHGALTTGWPKLKQGAYGVVSPFRVSNHEIFRTKRAYLPKLDAESRKKYFLRLTLEMLLDARYNPFTDGTNDGNEPDNYNYFKEFTSYAFVPVKVTIYDADGNALCHYANRTAAEGKCQGVLNVSDGKRGWESGAAAYGDCWLQYYDLEDLTHETGILGWKKNRHCIGLPKRLSVFHLYDAESVKFKVYDSFKKIDDGEYMPYPEQGGWLEISVMRGAICKDWEESGGLDETFYWDKFGLYDKARWLLYKMPEVEVVRNTLIHDEAELDDIEYTGYINRAAKEEISIDTTCGTADLVCPTAKGIYHRTSDSLQVQQLTRAGRTDHPEKLLIGTLYSQYADRKTTLSGEARIDCQGLQCYTERNQDGKRFMLMSDVQDVIADTTEAEYCELRPDEYDSIEEVSS